jgi:hypothetical protein
MKRLTFLATIFAAISAALLGVKREKFPNRIKVNGNEWHRGDQIYDADGSNWCVYSIPGETTCAFLEETGRFMIYRYGSNDYETIHIAS